MIRALLLAMIAAAGAASAATDVQVKFTLDTTDSQGNPIQQQRVYWIYRPDGLPKDRPVPMILVMDGGPATFFHRKADQAGFLVVSCGWAGNVSGNPGTGWVADDPRIAGYEDFDYTSEVIRRVRASDNAGDAFITGLSKGGHMSLAYACERPSMLRAASTVDEFMGLTSNIPSAPLPIIGFHGTADTNVPYTMVRDTVDAWRAIDGLLGIAPVTTFEASPLKPGNVSQATWRGGVNGTQVALVTIIGGTHTHALPTVETGYDFTDGIWAFFSQFLTPSQDSPQIVANPVDNIQTAGYPATFWAVASSTLPVTYQWQRNGEDIPGATSNWLTVSAETGAVYRAVVQTDAGTATSEGATVTVRPAAETPTVTTPPADQSVTAGQPVTFTAAVAGATRLQWQKNGVNIAGATSATVSIPTAITSDSGAAFILLATGSSGTVTTSRATLTVMPAPNAPIMLVNPARVRLTVGRQATFSVTAWSATPMTYQWQKGAFLGNMADIPGATSSAYTTPPGTLADHLTLFRCVVSNATGSTVSASEMLFVTAAAVKPTDVTSPATAAAQAGAPFQYTIQSSGGSIPLTFTADPLPDGLALDPNTGVISGAPAATGVFTIAIGSANSAGSFSRNLTLTVTSDPPVLTWDAWRRANFGASANDPAIAGETADPDGDGVSNLDEFLAGTNPLSVTGLLACRGERNSPGTHVCTKTRGPLKALIAPQNWLSIMGAYGFGREVGPSGRSSALGIDRGHLQAFRSARTEHDTR